MSVLKCYFNIFYLIIFPTKQGNGKPRKACISGARERIFESDSRFIPQECSQLYSASARDFHLIPRGVPDEPIR